MPNAHSIVQIVADHSAEWTGGLPVPVLICAYRSFGRRYRQRTDPTTHEPFILTPRRFLWVPQPGSKDNFGLGFFLRRA